MTRRITFSFVLIRAECKLCMLMQLNKYWVVLLFSSLLDSFPLHFVHDFYVVMFDERRKSRWIVPAIIFGRCFAIQYITYLFYSIPTLFHLPIDILIALTINSASA